MHFFKYILSKNSFFKKNYRINHIQKLLCGIKKKKRRKIKKKNTKNTKHVPTTAIKIKIGVIKYKFKCIYYAHYIFIGIYYIGNQMT